MVSQEGSWALIKAETSPRERWPHHSLSGALEFSATRAHIGRRGLSPRSPAAQRNTSCAQGSGIDSAASNRASELTDSRGSAIEGANGANQFSFEA